MRIERTALFVTATCFALGVGCASSTPYVMSSIESEISVRNSKVNEFSFVRVYDDRDELVIYGKVEPHYSYCRSSPLVELSIEQEDGAVLEHVCIPIVNRGTRRRGWFGASFRARLPCHESRRAKIQLSFRDSRCF